MTDDDAPHGTEDAGKPFWARLLTRQIQFGLDLSALVAAFAVAYLLRFEFSIPPDEVHRLFVQLPLVVLLQFAALFFTGVYTFIWRYVGMGEVTSFLAAAWWSFLPLLLLRLGLPGQFAQWRVPLSILLVDTALAFGLVLALRVGRRALHERYEKGFFDRATGRPAKPVLLVGAGRAGVLAAREITGRADTRLDVRGFVDDDLEKIGSVIHGVRVLGTTRDIPRLVGELEVDHVIITIAQAGRTDIRRIMGICEQVPVKVRIIPGLFEILGGKVEVSRIRDVQIEDLLGRDPVRLDQEALRSFLAGRTVMVTGAGGSIGSELCRQVVLFGAATVLLVERSEAVLFVIDRELRSSEAEATIVPLVADVGDRPRMEEIFRMWRPSVVVHAAAHKHVPLMELNPGEAVKNNVLATRCLAELAGTHGVEAFIQISTDKAVRPRSVMGASKRVAELVVQALNGRFVTRFVSVRFGNVLGSAGSVVPIFREQILAGGPVTVTHPDMVRYFMTIPEAVQLVLQAGAMGRGGEIFVLDMGEPVRILDMAKDMIALFGLKPYEDVDIVFSGVRPGEKLFEELESDAEELVTTAHPKIYVGRINGPGPAEVESALERLRSLATAEGSSEELRRFFNAFLAEARVTVAQPAASPAGIDATAPAGDESVPA